MSSKFEAGVMHWDISGDYEVEWDIPSKYEVGWDVPGKYEVGWDIPGKYEVGWDIPDILKGLWDIPGRDLMLLGCPRSENQLSGMSHAKYGFSRRSQDVPGRLSGVPGHPKDIFGITGSPHDEHSAPALRLRYIQKNLWDIPPYIPQDTWDVPSQLGLPTKSDTPRDSGLKWAGSAFTVGTLSGAFGTGRNSGVKSDEVDSRLCWHYYVENVGGVLYFRPNSQFLNSNILAGVQVSAREESVAYGRALPRMFRTKADRVFENAPKYYTNSKGITPGLGLSFPVCFKAHRIYCPSRRWGACGRNCLYQLDCQRLSADTATRRSAPTSAANASLSARASDSELPSLQTCEVLVSLRIAF
ncbi:hypothetical protein B0H11DRAFT_1900877 [Mycena galericulata]|nr:hypothetical protein B0H11DRAFT_1900877 [Mycena galericulata]